MEFITSLTIPLDILARAGGGGSSSGGSGGSGGDSFLVLAGYIPMHFVGALLRRPMKASGFNPAVSVMMSLIGFVVAAIYAIFWIYLWGGLGFFVGLAALVGAGAGLYGWFGKIKQSPLVKAALQRAALNDSAWDEAKLVEFSRRTFMKYQADWSSFNIGSIAKYTTADYAIFSSLLLRTLKDIDRVDQMEDVEIISSEIVNLNDSDDDSQDRFTVAFVARANDKLVEATSGNVLFTDKSDFTEYWDFERSGNTWLLAGITQNTMDLSTLNQQLAQFANQNKYFFNPDMGWLLIPKRGQLFGGAKFGTSDLNNHIIGLYNDKIIIQLYSYVENPNVNSKPYTIAQATLTGKQYGEIVVRRRGGFRLFGGGIKGLEKVETEWPDFNKKYEVYATSYEQATSFELLNPSYMERLEALGYEVNIEVVDNVIYLYAPEIDTSVEVYQSMLDVLYEAFREMRL